MKKMSFYVFLKSTRLQDNETTSRDVSTIPIKINNGLLMRLIS